MNLGDERTKAIIAAAVIAISLLYSVKTYRDKLAPATPQGTAVAAAPAGGPAATPAAGSATAATANGTAPANGAGAPAGAPAGGPAASPDKPLVPEHGLTVAVKGQSAASKDLSMKMVVRDPFSMTPGYQRKVDAAQEALSGPMGTTLPTPASSSRAPAFDLSGLKSGSSIRLSTLPPAVIGLDSVRDGLSGRLGASRETLPDASRASQTAAPVSRPNPPDSHAAPNSTDNEMEYSLTGTVDGDTPMAILRSKSGSALVREGDWLGGDYQVRRILPRRVVLRDRSGHAKILNLGVASHAI